ncbi:hypothetical protein FSC37_22450 [Piscinibacter aquaticus]|uniref:Uncharacterized protein n=1 Tax=Piscinibacter aquaticus TaxID=392597 RepID=A0A5C6TR18_9BURK|nr:hypothetical protein FSC37_22450 [Piscinibacter aquaticus]
MAERFVYFGERLVGLYPVCIAGRAGTVYLSQEFFNDNSIGKKDIVICDGRPFWTTGLHFHRIDAKSQITANPKPSDFNASTSLAAEEKRQKREAIQRALKENEAYRTSLNLLEYNISGWKQTAYQSLVADLRGTYYGTSGLYAVDGMASSQNGSTRGVITNLGWSRTFIDAELDLRAGVISESSLAGMATVYGIGIKPLLRAIILPPRPVSRVLLRFPGDYKSIRPES